MPIYIERELPCGLDKDRVREWAARVAQEAGYDVEWYTQTKTWDKPGNAIIATFRINHPTMTSYDDAVDQEEHRRFIDEVMAFYRGQTYTPLSAPGEKTVDYNLWVYSES